MERTILFMGGDTQTGTTMLSLAAAEELAGGGKSVLYISAGFCAGDEYLPRNLVGVSDELITGLMADELSGEELKNAAVNIRGVDVLKGTRLTEQGHGFLPDDLQTICSLAEKFWDWILIDGGIHHLNYFGQKMAMEIPPIDVIHNGYKYSIDEMWNSRGSVRSNSRENPYCICGSLCTIADVIVREVSLPELNVGDVICFNRCGAYSVTEAPALFLSRELPSIYTKKGDKFTLVRDKIKASKINVKGL